MASFVYLITNLITSKYYIGKTNNKNLRWKQHIYKSKNKNTYLYNAINKYGHNNFIFEIIKECETESQAYEYERVLIELFNLRNKKYGYNIIEGGSGGSKGYRVSNKIKKYFHDKYLGSKSVRAKFSDEEVILILDNYSTGKWTSEKLAEKYNCGKSTIIRIISGESYSNIIYNRSNFKTISNNHKIKNIPKGSSVKTSKLSDNDVILIRKMYESNEYSYQQLANKFKVSKTNIYFIIKNKSRKNAK